MFDTLYGIDTEWKAQPRMVEGYTVEHDGLTWTLKLRDGLRFHDKEPVLARDVVASIHRFAPRVIFADALSALDDRICRARRVTAARISIGSITCRRVAATVSRR